MARYEPCATTGRVPSLFLKAEHSSQGVGYASLGIFMEGDRLQRRATGLFDFPRGRRTTMILDRRASWHFALRRMVARSAPISPSEDEQQSVHAVVHRDTRSNRCLATFASRCKIKYKVKRRNLHWLT